MTNFNELQEETREIITDLLNDGSDPDAPFILSNITSLIMILIP